ncbi:competence protein CoiA [Virgibacillus sp. W0181]|uniref:competence protein CoiA n=1 Tax=Virgibacillus sp. W0181 TaxID=3391581 RepID=UPI003F47BD71
MLQAKTSVGQFVTPARLTSKEIDWHRQHTTFYCPVCQHKVILKAGMRIIPHFAHHSDSDCSSAQRGEGAYHEKGKLMLYEWLKNQQMDVQLEPYIGDINQRPDLLVSIKNRHIVIEFQCATISQEQVQKRNKGYQDAGLIPIWILGANQMNRIQKRSLKLNALSLQCMYRFSSTTPLTLIYFCPDSLRLLLFQHIFMTTTKKAIGTFHFHHIQAIRFTDLFKKQPLTQTELQTLWFNEKRAFRLYPRRRIYGSERKWLQWLYDKNTHFENLPSIIHLPVSSQYLMKVPPWNWQSRLCLDIIHPLPIRNTFSFNRCKTLLHFYSHSSTDFPLIQTDIDPIHQYLQHLIRLNIIKQTAKDQYEKIHSLKFYTHIEDALKGDAAVLKQLITKCM